MGRQGKRIARFLLGVCVCAMAVLGGCKTKKTERSIDVAHLSEEVSFFSKTGWCEKGVLQLDRELMVFTEFATKNTYPLCSNSYCNHEPYNEITNPDPECEATLKGLVRACIRDKELYAFLELEWGKTTVMVRDLTQNGYRKLAELPYLFENIAYNYIIGDTAYLFMGELHAEEALGNISDKDMVYVLLELNLNTGEYREKLRLDGPERFQLHGGYFAEDGIYCYCYYDSSTRNEKDDSFELLDYREKAYFVPYSGGEPKEIAEQYFSGINKDSIQSSRERTLCVNQKGVFVTDYLNRVVCISHETGEETEVFSVQEGEGKFFGVFVSGDILCVVVKKEDGTKERYFINLMDGSKRQLSGEHSYSAINSGLFSEDGLVSSEELHAIVDMSGQEENGRIVME